LTKLIKETSNNLKSFRCPICVEKGHKPNDCEFKKKLLKAWPKKGEVKNLVEFRKSFLLQ